MERKEKIMAKPTPEPTPKPTPWEDYVPTYIKDNAKGYRKYVDKLAQYLNSHSGGGGGLFTFEIGIDESENFFTETPFSEISASADAGKTVIALIRVQTVSGEYNDSGFGIFVEKLELHGVTGYIFQGCLSEDYLPDGDTDYESIMTTKTGVCLFVVVDDGEGNAVIPTLETQFNSTGTIPNPVFVKFSMTDATHMSCDTSYKVIRYLLERDIPVCGFFNSQSFTASSTQNILNKCFTPFALYMGGSGSTSNIYGNMLSWDGSTAKKYNISIASDDAVSFSTSTLSA